jgi:hypothetical protein
MLCSADQVRTETAQENVRINSPGRHYASMKWQHLTDHDLERYYLGMVKIKSQLGALEEHILACGSRAERAEEAQEYVDAMRVAGLDFGFPYEGRR